MSEWIFACVYFLSFFFSQVYGYLISFIRYAIGNINYKHKICVFKLHTDFPTFIEATIY